MSHRRDAGDARRMTRAPPHLFIASRVLSCSPERVGVKGAAQPAKGTACRAPLVFRACGQVWSFRRSSSDAAHGLSYAASIGGKKSFSSGTLPGQATPGRGNRSRGPSPVAA
jgi:hypothetical protein